MTLQHQQSFSFTVTPAKSTRRNLVIEAGAGTGKTTAIVAEVLRLMIEHPDLDPERIVLMTFTEKAAGEIADRIRVALEELANGASVWPVDSANPLVEVPENAQPAIAHHLANIDALRSQTIHSFCQSLLRSFPIEAGLDPQFKIIEGFERSLLYGQLYDAWLDEETRVHPSEESIREWELLFAHAGYLFQIRELILTLINRRDLLAETDCDFGDFDRDVAPRLIDALIWIRRDSASCKDAAAAQVAEYIRETPFEGGAIDVWIDYLQPIAASIRDIKLPGCGALKEPMVVLRSGGPGDSIYDRLISHRAAIALLSLTRRFLSWLDEEKRTLGVVDFDDLLLRTLALLDDPHVLARARAQFDHIFVDEFQDTDRTQAHIIDRLARDGSNAFVAGKTVVVGDPKQSIYGFRRADPETYYRMTEDLEKAGAERRVITDQYRSDPPLLEIVNAMFARLFPEQPHDPNVFRPAYNILHAARGTSRRELDARITLLHAHHDDRSDRYFAEAEAIAEWIQANREGGEKDLQRFAILFRRLTRLDDYLDTLRRYGIEYVLPPMRLFLDRRAPVDLLAVLRAIAYSFDLGANISAARTPYFGLTDIEVAGGAAAFPSPGASRHPLPASGARGDEGGGPSPRMRGEGGRRPDEGPAAPQEPWLAFMQTMSRFRDAARHLTVSELIDLIISTTGIEQIYDAAADGDRHRTHLEHVRALAFEYDQRQGGSVQQFVDEIARRRSEPEEAEPSLVDEAQNAVRIMSVHAAKGLEFETVILPDLAVQAPQNNLNLFAIEEPRSLVLAGRADTISGDFIEVDGMKLKEISKLRDEAENRRLFYVAVTRAKTDVVFVINPESWKTGFQRTLLTALGETPLAWPDSGREVHMTEIGPIAFEKRDAHGAEGRKRRRLHDAELEAELAAAEIVPYEAVTPETIAETLTPAEVAARRAGSRNKAAGVLLHRVLELWDGRSDVEPLLQQLAIEAAADADAIARVRRRLSTIARSATMQRIAAAETLGREVPVRFLENGTLIERRIDRLVREAGRDLVIDYKSGVPEPSRVEKDRLQVQKYAEAIGAITGRECAALLWYVDLESDQVVESSSRRVDSSTT